MIYSALAFFFLLALVAVNSLSIPDYSHYTFEDFERQFSKSYSCEGARQTARSNFYRNLAEVNAHNSQAGITYTKGINDKSDLTQEELISRYTGYNMGMASTKLYKGAKQTVFKPSGKALPTAVDWRTKNAVTPVKDQGGCGSCWAFSATESIESQVILQTGKTLILSPQDVLACTPNPQHCGGTGGCGGAIPELAFMWAADGIALESTVPYQGKNTPCQTGISRAATVDIYAKLGENDPNDLLAAVAELGPISVSVAASSWGLYQKGIFNGCTGDNDINHAVQLVGYGTDSGTDYWIVRNSWGASWGEQGYIRLYRGSQESCGVDTSPQDGSGCDGGPQNVTVCGTCGIWYDNSVPLKVSLL